MCWRAPPVSTLWDETNFGTYGDRGPELDIVATPRPRKAFDAWLDERAGIAAAGGDRSGWHLAVLPFTDGGAGVSVIGSGGVTSPVELCRAVAEAASAQVGAADFYPDTPHPRWRTAGKQVAWAARFVRSHRGSADPADPPAMSAADGHGEGAPATVTVFVDAHDGDARAAARGGTSDTPPVRTSPASAPSIRPSTGRTAPMPTTSP